MERNELTEILRLRREKWFADLLRHFPDATDATDIDPVSTALIVASAVHYLIARSLLHADFNGLDIDTDDGWSRVEQLVHTLAHRTIARSDHV